MTFEQALKGMKAGKKATFARCTGCFFINPVFSKKRNKYVFRLYYQTAEGIVSRQHKVSIGWVLNCEWRFVDD